MENELLTMLLREREEKHSESARKNKRAISQVFQALNVLLKTIEYGICPVTAKHPVVANSISSLRTLSEPVKLGQRIIILVGGCNGQELHEVSRIDQIGRILATVVIDGQKDFQVPNKHEIQGVDL